MVDQYTGYFDESGTHDASEYVVVAGFISNELQWGEFSTEWQDALDRYGLDFFHMSEFENQQGPYRSWSEEEGKKRLNELLEIIDRHVFSSVGTVVPKASFDAIVSPHAKRMCGDAYGLAAIGCFKNVADTARDPRINGVMEYILEAGQSGSAALLKIFHQGRKEFDWIDNNRISSLEIRDKRVCLPLQASDILAYELFKHAARSIGNEHRSTRHPLKLLGRKPQEWHYIDDAELKAVEDWLSRFSP